MTEGDYDYSHALRGIKALRERAEKAEAEAAAMREALTTVHGIIGESRGLDGWHRNGDIATWDEFEVVAEIDAALSTGAGKSTLALIEAGRKLAEMVRGLSEGGCIYAVNRRHADGETCDLCVALAAYERAEKGAGR